MLVTVTDWVCDYLKWSVRFHNHRIFLSCPNFSYNVPPFIGYHFPRQVIYETTTINHIIIIWNYLLILVNYLKGNVVFYFCRHKPYILQ